MCVAPVPELATTTWPPGLAVTWARSETTKRSPAWHSEVAGRMAEYEGYLARLAEREALEWEDDRDEEGGR